MGGAAGGRGWCEDTGVCRGNPLSPGCHLGCGHLLRSQLLIWSMVISSLRLPRRHPSSLPQVSESLAHFPTSCAFRGTKIALFHSVKLLWPCLVVPETPGGSSFSESCCLPGFFPKSGEPLSCSLMPHLKPTWRFQCLPGIGPKWSFLCIPSFYDLIASPEAFYLKLGKFF